MKRYCLALDLKEDPDLINEYKVYHENVWPEIKESITDSGIVDMEIYCVSNRLIMIIETSDDFTFERKVAMDETNPVVIKWEKLMAKYQQTLPNTPEGVKWVLMEKVFKL
ncbi:MAG: L-rhamnose mutarotase [Cyclobacteriaceae bacterium]|nr:L-rhamnose mutarotase [Cyclobacteriaceae bacterium]